MRKNEYGRVTNKLDQLGTEILRYKYDAGSRLTNRWSAARTNAYYAYDPVGNLTNIDYAVSPDVSFAYDALNRLTTMVDGVGTTVYVLRIFLASHFLPNRERKVFCRLAALGS